MEHDLIAATLQHAAEDLLAAARVAVDVRGVEERDARVERRVDDGPRRFLVEPAAEVVATEPDDGHLERSKLPDAHHGTLAIRSRLMRYFEDFKAGDVTEVGPVTVSEQEIVDFATRYDPQPFHTDPEAAKASPFGGLIASGWHTTALFMGMFVREILLDSASLGSPGVAEIRWTAPVRPGDTLTGRVTVTDVQPSATNPNRGTVFTMNEVFNQEGERVMTLKARGFFARRP